MTSIPLILPLNAGEAGALGDLVYQQVEDKPLTGDLRNRFAARVPSLGLKTFTPFTGSLQQDPIHPSTYYVAIDRRGAGAPRSWLLRIALASSPASGLFPGAMLIGRMRQGSGRELVINAIPFGAADLSSIRTYAEKVDRAFLPRPQGAASAITVRRRGEEAAFLDFRAVLKGAGVNLASLECPFHTGVWAAIRAGWREGYSVGAEPIPIEPIDAAKTAIEAAADSTRFTIVGSDLSAVEELYGHIAMVKSSQGSWKHFDFELSLGVAGPEELRLCLEWLKTRGCPAQLIAPKPFPSKYTLAEWVEAVRPFNTTLSFASDERAELEEIGRATGGRFNCVASGEDVDLRWIAARLLGKSIPV